ncbi:MAG: hypothetical protein IE909_15650, partial [Campylobacterales bacterium]|nr:hypothetical protein [Campylobacterales bacterium]
TVAIIKPMEAQAVKNIVDAKNATDEMEFDIDDETLDFLFDTIPLPTYTSFDLDKQNNFIKTGVLNV